MSFYELAVRFEAGDDTAALAFAVDVDRAVRGEHVMPTAACIRHRCSIDRMTRVIDGSAPPEVPGC